MTSLSTTSYIERTNTKLSASNRCMKPMQPLIGSLNMKTKLLYHWEMHVTYSNMFAKGLWVRWWKDRTLNVFLSVIAKKFQKCYPFLRERLFLVVRICTIHTLLIFHPVAPRCTLLNYVIVTAGSFGCFGHTFIANCKIYYIPCVNCKALYVPVSFKKPML